MCFLIKSKISSTKVFIRIRKNYFWPGMGTDIRQWILACDDCASRNVARLKKNKMIKYQVGGPFERVAMDVMRPLPRTTQGKKYILVIGDYFTKWMEAYPLPNQEAKTIADVFTQERCARRNSFRPGPEF